MEYPITEVKPGIRRQILSANGNLMQVLIYFDYPLIDVLHQHPHEQCTYVLEGEFEFCVEDKKFIRKKGESIYFPSQTLHCANCLSKGKLLDTFSPIRQDFLDSLAIKK